MTIKSLPFFAMTFTVTAVTAVGWGKPPKVLPCNHPQVVSVVHCAPAELNGNLRNTVCSDAQGTPRLRLGSACRTTTVKNGPGVAAQGGKCPANSEPIAFFELFPPSPQLRAGFIWGNDMLPDQSNEDTLSWVNKVADKYEAKLSNPANKKTVYIWFESRNDDPSDLPIFKKASDTCEASSGSPTS